MKTQRPSINTILKNPIKITRIEIPTLKIRTISGSIKMILITIKNNVVATENLISNLKV